jgi:hypothetical protein
MSSVSKYKILIREIHHFLCIAGEAGSKSKMTKPKSTSRQNQNNKKPKQVSSGSNAERVNEVVLEERNTI